MAKLATRKRLDMTSPSKHLMDTMNQRVSTRQQAIDLKVGTKSTSMTPRRPWRSRRRNLPLTRAS
jgi:hypothetical protein